MALKDFLLVYARNIGKGFKKNTETKQYDVALGKGLKLDKSGNIYVDVKAAGGVDLADVNNAISKDKTNELSLKEDGLYVGQKANYPNAYVDSISGVDGSFEDGYGTRAKPFKTIKHAIEQGEYGKLYNISLHERQEHVLDEDVFVRSSTLNFGSYGDEIDACRGEYRDYFQHILGFVKDKNLHAKIVFKKLHPQRYPNNTENYYFNFYPTCLIQDYSGSLSINFSGVGIIIDLGSMQITTNEHTPLEDYLVKHKGTVKVTNGNIALTNFTFSTRGIPQVDRKLAIREGNLNQFLRDDLYSVGLIRTGVDSNVNITLRNWVINENNPAAKCMFLAEVGWGGMYGTSVTFNFDSQYGATAIYPEITKRVGNISKVSIGDKTFVKLPVSDMNLTEYWNF